MTARFVTHEQFKALPDKVQNDLIEWWKPQIGDLFYTPLSAFGMVKSCILDKETLKNVIESKGTEWERKPLLRLDQLWDYIEEKTGGVLQVIVDTENAEKEIAIFEKHSDLLDEPMHYYDNVSSDKLEAFLQVAIKITEQIDGNAQNC